MPTVLRIDGYRFFFYSSDRAEPVHIHTEKGDAYAKVWIKPVRLQSSHGFNRQEIKRILKITEEHRLVIEEAWNEFFND